MASNQGLSLHLIIRIDHRLGSMLTQVGITEAAPSDVAPTGPPTLLGEGTHCSSNVPGLHSRLAVRRRRSRRKREIVLKIAQLESELVDFRDELAFTTIARSTTDRELERMHNQLGALRSTGPNAAPTATSVDALNEKIQEIRGICCEQVYLIRCLKTTIREWEDDLTALRQELGVAEEGGEVEDQSNSVWHGCI